MAPPASVATVDVPTGGDDSRRTAGEAAESTSNYVSMDTEAAAPQHQSEKDLWLFIIDYDLVNADGEDFNNSFFGHLRYNHEFGEVVRVEAFTQGQFNSVTKIDVRYLNGIGLRLKLSPYERAKFYLCCS